jgi:hypothetical protein
MSCSGDDIWPLPDGIGMLHSRPKHREKPSQKGKKPCRPESAKQKSKTRNKDEEKP